MRTLAEIESSIEYYNGRVETTREHIEELESNLIDFNETLELLYKEKLEAELELVNKEIDALKSTILENQANFGPSTVYLGEW